MCSRAAYPVVMFMISPSQTLLGVSLGGFGLQMTGVMMLDVHVCFLRLTQRLRSFIRHSLVDLRNM